MEKAVRRIGVFTSGGDAPGMNAAIRAVVRTSLHMGIECVGIRRGYHGLINGDFTKLTFESVSDLSRRGGSPSSRDRITATYMGYEAVRLLAEGKTCRVVALQGENYVDYDITEALQMTKSLDQHTYEVMRALTGVH